MLILARQARGMTQGELALAVGIGQGTISKAESGVTSPSPSDLSAIADVLDFPVHFFTQQRQVPGPGLSESFHRKRQKAGAKVLNQVHAVAAIGMMAAADLLTSCDVDMDVPDLDVDEFDGNAPKIARTVRAAWQVPPGPVVNLTALVEAHGIVVIPSRFGTRHIDGFSRRYLRDARPYIFMSDGLPPDRWRWTLAHELAHMVMHRNTMERDEKEIEAEADRFAGEFLAPAHETKPDLWGLSLVKLANLKRYWKISMAALVMQAKHLNMATPSQAQRLYIELAKAGYRMREPEELDPPVETPNLVRRLARTHIDELGYSREELANALKLKETDLQRLCFAGEPSLRLIA